jgi:hypothetical protein
VHLSLHSACSSPVASLPLVPSLLQFDKKAVVVRTAVQKQVPLFSHLPQYERETSLSLKLKVNKTQTHTHTHAFFAFLHPPRE